MAIDLTTIKTQLSAMPGRAAKQDEVLQWSTNTLRALPESILPRVPTGARPALERLATLCESIGPRILETRAFGTIGDVNWGGDSKRQSGTAEVDDAVDETDLESLATELLYQGQITGMMAGVVRRDPVTEEILVEPMLGHLELVYAENSVQAVIGILQVWREKVVLQTGGEKEMWSVRLYDIRARTLLGWKGLESPDKILKAQPVEVVERSAEYPDGAPIPRFVVLKKHPLTYQPMGEMEVLLPLIKSDWSSQLRGDRAEENTAFPQLKLIGKAETATSERSSAHIIRLAQGGDAAFLDPGDLSQLHVHHDRKLERLREDASMPGAFVGGSTPSGEAIREQNQKFISSCQFYAKRLSRVLTQLLQDLATAAGATLEAAVGVQINREFTKASEIETVVLLYDKGLIPLDAAVRAISVFLPTWTDEQVEAFIAEQLKPISDKPALPSTAAKSEEEPAGLPN